MQEKYVKACISYSSSYLSHTLAYGEISQGRIIEAHPATAWRWVKTAVKRTEELGKICPGEAYQHPYAAPQLRPASSDERASPSTTYRAGLGTASIQTALIYLKLVPDLTGSLAMVP